jgi:hypothetical protein
MEDKMVKRGLLILILVAFLSGMVFAEEKNNAIFVDVGSTITGVIAGGFGFGLGYERGITDSFSAIVNASYVGFTIDGFPHDTGFLGIAAGLGVRYYPLAVHNPVQGWFIDIGGALSHINIKHGEEAVSNVFELRLLTGWKLVFGQGFFLEPGFRYTLAFGDVNMPIGSDLSADSLSGFALWLGMGWAF